MTDPNSAKKSAAPADNPQAANPNAPAEVVVDPSDPNYLEKRAKMAADEARPGQEAAAKLRELNALGAAVITAQGTVVNPGEGAPPAGSPQGTVPTTTGGTTVTESVNTTRTAGESGVRRSTGR